MLYEWCQFVSTLQSEFFPNPEGDSSQVTGLQPISRCWDKWSDVGLGTTSQICWVDEISDHRCRRVYDNFSQSMIMLSLMLVRRSFVSHLATLLPVRPCNSSTLCKSAKTATFGYVGIMWQTVVRSCSFSRDLTRSVIICIMCLCACARVCFYTEHRRSWSPRVARSSCFLWRLSSCVSGQNLMVTACYCRSQHHILSF